VNNETLFTSLRLEFYVYYLSLLYAVSVLCFKGGDTT